MKRFYFISDDLDDLERLEAELEDNGLQQPQIHVLSEDDAELARHRLNEVHSFMKTDVVHSAIRGAVLGMVAAFLALVVANLSGLPQAVGWAPFTFWRSCCSAFSPGKVVCSASKKLTLSSAVSRKT